MMAKDERQLVLAARTKLNEYIDALWIGRADAAHPHVSIYLERLAAAARLSALLGSPRAVETMVEIVRQENKAFPRDLLSTDAGRAARGAFNLFARALSTLESEIVALRPSPIGPESVAGKPLSTVSFVWDYVQLGFNGCGFNVFCPMVVRTPDDNVRSGDTGFRDRLCETIGQVVRGVDISDERVEIRFDRCSIEFLVTLAEGATSPEPFTFFDTGR
jgi:hypothetical protein